MPIPPAEAGSRADPRDQIAIEVLRVHQESYGTRADKVAVHIMDDVVLVVLDELRLAR